MARRTTPQELADAAELLAIGQRFVEYGGHLYRPVDFRTLAMNPASPDVTVWVEVDHDDLKALSRIMAIPILFETDAMYRSFRYMVSGFARHHSAPVEHLLVRVEDKVMLLNDQGKLEPVTGGFVPNFLNVPYDPDSPLVEELWGYISEWTGGEEQAHSLLNHISTALQPSWSASRYVLLIGEGKNGKSTLLKMVDKLIGSHNISGVSRQDMAAKSTAIADLNGKLLNIIFDGPKEFLKDNSTEKTLVVGERMSVKLLYESFQTRVQTNALFIEGLQTEPHVADKSPALQKRLARFYFPNVYEEDLGFEEKMLQKEMLAAFLVLLLQHWVLKSEKSEKLRLTAASLDLQMEAVKAGSPVLRFLEDVAQVDSRFLENVLSGTMLRDTFYVAFVPWLESNGYKNTEKHFLDQLMSEQFVMHNSLKVAPGKYTTKWHIRSVKVDAANAIQHMLNGAEVEVLEGD